MLKSQEQNQEEEQFFGDRRTTRKHDPRHPSEQEIIENEMTDLPFRSVGADIPSR